MQPPGSVCLDSERMRRQDARKNWDQTESENWGKTHLAAQGHPMDEARLRRQLLGLAA